MHLKQLIFFILSLLFFAVSNNGCSPERSVDVPPETPSENLNGLLNEAPFQWVDLDEVEVDTIWISPEHIFEERMFASESLYVTSPHHLTAFNEHLVVDEFGKGKVVALNNKGIPVKNVGRKGRGPGEFEHPYGLMSDDSLLYIYDFTQKRMSVFGQDYELVKTFDFRGVTAGSFSDKIVMNNELLVYQNLKASGFHGEDEGAKLLHVRSKAQPDSIYFSAIPRIVPVGMQPAVYNNLNLAINSHNDIFTAFPGLPYLMIYEDLEHTQTIGLKSFHFDTTDSPSLQPTAPDGNKGVGVKNVLGGLKILDNGDLIFSSFKHLYHVKKEDGKYNPEKSYVIIREDTKEPLLARKLVTMQDDSNIFYALGWRKIFQLELPITE